MSREEAYAVVQESAMCCWESRGDESEPFLSLPAAGPRLAEFGRERLESLFGIGFYLRHVDEIFARFGVFSKLQAS